MTDVQSGKTVSIAIPDEKCDIEPTKGTLDIRYEDEHFLVVNKPHSMPVHPVKQHQSDTLANIVSYYCIQNGKPFVFRAINRLDKDTSGLVLNSQKSVLQPMPIKIKRIKSITLYARVK